MKNYRVSLKYETWLNVTAESEGEAIEKAKSEIFSNFNNVYVAEDEVNEFFICNFYEDAEAEDEG